MERQQKCKLCFKIFANGRALGGHMRSHMLNLPLAQKREQEEEEEEEEADHSHRHHDSSIHQLSKDTESASSSSSEEEAEEDDENEKGVYYGLREKPKRSIRLVDSEFSFAVDAASVVVQDRESETESSKNPTRRRSKRTRKSMQHHQYHLHQQRQQEQENNNSGKLTFDNKTTTESWVEPEPVTSSISDTTTEEDVAFCLMMLSRDKWKTEGKQNHHQQREQHDEEVLKEAERSIEETDESDGFKSCKTRARGKYRCGTCNKVFKSYQALGGHRASHKKLKLYAPIQQTEIEPRNNNNTNHNNGVTSSSVAVRRLHECPYCFRVFSSGQALGGHKRTHVLTVSPITPNPARSSTTTKIEDSLNLIDLNLPAPIDEDDLNQVELSAVSEAEFVNHIKSSHLLLCCCNNMR